MYITSLRSKTPLTQRANFKVPFKKKKTKPVPYYLKQNLPDKRFLGLRLEIHKRSSTSMLPDRSYWEPFIQREFKKSSRKPKKSRGSSVTFEKKQKLYERKFTEGVDIKRDKTTHSSKEIQLKKLNKIRENLSRKSNRKSVDSFCKLYIGRPSTHFRPHSRA